MSTLAIEQRLSRAFPEFPASEETIATLAVRITVANELFQYLDSVAASAAHAADVVFDAVNRGRAEVTITPQAWLAARFAGLAPETTQFMNAVVNRYILPAPPQGS
jgi:hypothetical protein